MKFIILACCVTLTFVCQAAGQKITSFYSSTEAKHVAVLVDSALEKNPVIDHLYHLCPGYGGYELIHHGGDLRSIIDIKFGKTVSNLMGPTFKRTRGSFPHKANHVVEWRGMLKENHFTPHAIIYRMAGTIEVEGKQVTKTTLIVVALNKGKSVVLGSFSGDGESEKAKALADSIVKK